MSINEELKDIITLFDNQGYTITQDKGTHPKSDANYFRITDIQWGCSNGTIHKIYEEVVYRNNRIGVVFHHDGVFKDFDSYLLRTYSTNFTKDSYFLHKTVYEEGLIFKQFDYAETKPSDILVAYEDMHKIIKKAVKDFYNYVII